MIAKGGPVVVGIGIECLDAERFDGLWRRRGTRLLERLFTQEELEVALTGRRAPERLAARFAAKVATRRALFGSPMKGRTRWQDFEVHRTPSGRPEMRLGGEALRRAQALGVSRLHLTLSHDAPLCVGQVLLESRVG